MKKALATLTLLFILTSPALATIYVVDEPQGIRFVELTEEPSVMPKVRISEFDEIIHGTALEYGIEPALVFGMVRAESRFNHRARSSAGARGLLQLMPGTAKSLGVKDSFNPRQNIRGGVSYLRQLIDRFGGNVVLALAGYNAGPGAVERHGGVPPYKQTRGYVKKVLRYRSEYLNAQG